MKQAIDEVSRYRSMDRLIPSPKNSVTIAALEVSNSMYWSEFLLTDLASVLLDSHCCKPYPERSSGLFSSYPVCASGRMVYLISLPISEGNYTQVRIAAFDGLFMSKWYTPAIMRYVLAVMVNDPSRVVRRHVARSACQSLALLVSMGEMKNSVKDTESLLIEEDGSLPEKLKEAKKSEVDMMIKVLRKDREIGKNEVLREFLMSIAL